MYETNPLHVTLLSEASAMMCAGSDPAIFPKRQAADLKRVKKSHEIASNCRAFDTASGLTVYPAGLLMKLESRPLSRDPENVEARMELRNDD